MALRRESLTAEVLEQPEGGGGLKDYGWFHTGDIGIGSSCRFINDSSASLRQVPPEDDSGNTPVAKGKVVNITEIKGGRCLAKGLGWVDLADLEWAAESTGAGVEARFLKICGRKKRALVLEQSGMPWVWSESLEGILKFSEYIDDICVGFDGPAVWGGEQKDPPVRPNTHRSVAFGCCASALTLVYCACAQWVLALIAPSQSLLKVPEPQRAGKPQPLFQSQATGRIAEARSPRSWLQNGCWRTCAASPTRKECSRTSTRCAWSSSTKSSRSRTACATPTRSCSGPRYAPRPEPQRQPWTRRLRRCSIVVWQTLRGVQWLNVLVRGGQVEETFTAEIVAAFERPLTTEEEETLASGGH